MKEKEKKKNCKESFGEGQKKKPTKIKMKFNRDFLSKMAKPKKRVTRSRVLAGAALPLPDTGHLYVNRDVITAIQAELDRLHMGLCSLKLLQNSERSTQNFLFSNMTALISRFVLLINSSLPPPNKKV